jgi:hypothetical protein
MRKGLVTLAGAFLIGCVLLSAVQAAPGQATSTPEERARWVQVTRKMEVNPLDKDNVKEAEWALKRVIEVTDIHVVVCGGIVDDLARKKFKYGGDLLRQYTLASAAFVIENPDKANDKVAVNMAAIASALKAYAQSFSRIPMQSPQSSTRLRKRRATEN